MFAASSLVVAVLATYASVAVLSLSASAPSFLGNLPGVAPLVSGLGWSQPKVASLLTPPGAAANASTGALADFSPISFAPVDGGAGHSAFSFTNKSSAALALQVQVHGALGVSASFVGTNGARTMTVQPHHQATVALTSDPMHAGPINGSLEISAVGLKSLSVPITGDQAPLPAGAVVATPAAHGAVDLSWSPSPSTGVAGYIVERSAAGGTPQPISPLTQSTTFVDQTPADGTYSYEVVAVATGSAAPQSTPGPAASATSDSTAPAPVAQLNLPDFINQGNVATVPVGVQLQPSSQASDTITVTVTDGTNTLTQTQAGGGDGSFTLQFNATSLSDGKITVSATATDSVGNPSGATTDTVVKNTAAPSPLTFGDLVDITQANVKNVQIPVITDPASAGDVVTVQLSDGSTTITGTATQSSEDTTASVSVGDASQLADGKIAVAGWITNAAGNRSPQASAQITKDTSGAPAPTFIGVAAGPDNPVGVVTAASQNAVIVRATFDQAPAAGDTLDFWVAGTKYSMIADGQSTTYTIDPPIDMSGLPDNTYNVGLKETDADGNITRTFTHFTKDVSGPEAATSVGVPAGPSNPAGYVNAATQTAATIVATFAGPTNPADQIALSVGGLALAPQSGGSDRAVFTADLSSLPDGTLPIDGTITDASGVTTSFSGTLIKDTQAPLAPYTAFVAGPPPNTITQSGAACVNVTVLFNQAPDPSDTVSVTLSDENTSVEGSAPAGDGQVHIGCIDASALSTGTIAVNVTVTDAAGNSTSMAGTSATKLACPPS